MNPNDELNRYASSASANDQENVRQNIDGMNRGPIAKVWANVQALWRMVRDPEAAVGPKAIALGALVYLISPIDCIPDIIPILGLTDDAAVITAAIAALADALEKYKNRG